jgi:hypothetical protein
VRVVGRVNGQVVAEAEMIFALVERRKNGNQVPEPQQNSAFHEGNNQ